MLLTLPHILNAGELGEVQSLLAHAAWADGRPGAGTQAKQVKNNEQLPHDDPVSRAVRELVLRGLDRRPLFLSAALPKRVFPPRLNRYSGASNFYGNHVDGSVRFVPGSGQRLRTDLSCTVFLTDPADYDGGELVIEDTFGPRAVKLAAGHAVLYPGTSVHQVTPVTRGARVACFFWVESLVRSDAQRQLLFQMDMALTRLREAHGDGPETTALAGTYHNLLRMWADT
jgi:PKHD-type hydroxylase